MRVKQRHQVTAQLIKKYGALFQSDSRWFLFITKNQKLVEVNRSAFFLLQDILENGIEKNSLNIKQAQFLSRLRQLLL